MQWKFWRRGRSDKSETGSSAQPMPQDWRTLPLLPANTVKEVLGLQQLIGNQAVLRLLAPNSGSAKASRTEG